MNRQQSIPAPFQDALKNFTIDPMTNWERYFNPQVSISVNYGDVEVENNVLRRAGSYGKQLGRIFDVLTALIRVMPDDQLRKLRPEERAAMMEFLKLHDKVDRAVNEAREPR